MLFKCILHKRILSTVLAIYVRNDQRPKRPRPKRQIDQNGINGHTIRDGKYIFPTEIFTEQFFESFIKVLRMSHAFFKILKFTTDNSVMSNFHWNFKMSFLKFSKISWNSCFKLSKISWNLRRFQTRSFHCLSLHIDQNSHTRSPKRSQKNPQLKRPQKNSTRILGVFPLD